MTRFATLDDLEVAGKRVLVRADLNVPMQGGRVGCIAPQFLIGINAPPRTAWKR